MNDYNSASITPATSNDGLQASARALSEPHSPTGHSRREDWTTTPSRTGSPDWPAIAQFLAAFVIIGVYIASMWLMTQRDGAPAPQWDRLVFLFSGFEAIVFVATGAIFGTRVQRASAEAAHEQSRQARDELGAERERASQATTRAASLEESAANLIEALKVYAETVPQNTSNGQAPTPTSGQPGRPGGRGPDGSTIPPIGDSGLNYAIRMAEHFLSPGRK